MRGFPPESWCKPLIKYWIANMKLAIVISHPIQYFAPFFRLLAQHAKLELRVFYTYSQWQDTYYDKEFGRDIRFDIPLLEGYDYQFSGNEARKPGLQSFFGIHCPGLAQEVAAFGPSALLVHGWNYRAHLSIMRHFKGRVPVYFRGDSHLLDAIPGWKKTLRKWWLTWVYSYIDYALYVGSANKAYYLACGLKEDQLIHVPHSVDNALFEREGLDGQSDSGQIQVLFVGKFMAKKDPLILMECAKRLKSSGHTEFQFIFVGDGEQKELMEKAARKLDNVQITPFQTQRELVHFYHQADVLCIPSIGPNETWGLVVNEAMAAGIPVIASHKVGCVADLIIPAKTGFVFDAGNADELEAILKSLKKGKLVEMGRHARQHIKFYSLQTAAGKLVDHLESCG